MLHWEFPKFFKVVLSYSLPASSCNFRGLSYIYCLPFPCIEVGQGPIFEL